MSQDARIPYAGEVTLKDADGKEHRYQVMAHPTDDGIDIMFELLGLAGEPIGRLAESALKGGDLLDMVQRALQGAVSEGGVSAEDMGEIAGALQSLDLSGAGRDLRTALASTEGRPLLKRILAHTWRDGVHLANGVGFGSAYQRNYLEMLQAAWCVIRINRFFPLPGI